MSDKISLFNKRFLFLLISFIISFFFIGLIIFLASPSTKGVLFGLEMPPEFVSHFINLLPGPLWTDILFLYGAPILMFIIISFIAPYTNKGFVKIHRIFYIFRQKPFYGLCLPSTKIYASKLIFRSIMAGFLSFVISAYFVQIGLGHLFRYGYAPSELFVAEATFLGTFFFLPFVLLLFFILWALEDSGIVSYRTFKDKRKNVDINGVYKIYKGFVEYTVGFSTLILYYVITNDALIKHNPGDPAFLIPLILFFLPFIICGFCAIPIFLYEKYFDRTLKRVKLYLKNQGYNEINIPEFENIEIR